MRLKNGEKLLDAGCCFGQDIRELVEDGTLAENLYDLEIESKLVDLGYDLFHDREKLRPSIIISDIMDDSEQLATLTGKIDILVVIKFMHFWN